MKKKIQKNFMKVLTCGMLLCFFTGCKSVEPEVVKPEPPMETMGYMEGIILSVSNQELSLSKDAEHQVVFVIKDANVQNQAVLEKDDKVKIAYKKDNTQNIAEEIWIIAKAEHLDKAQQLMKTMTLEEKVGQMFLVRCPTDQQIEDIATYALGGYILFDRDVNDDNQTSLAEKIASYQSSAKIPLIITTDEEGGTVNRLSWYPQYRGVPFWSPQDLYNTGGIDEVLSDLKEKAELLLSMGINVNLAPVADVSVDPANFIYARSLGKDATETASYIEEVVAASKSLGIGTVLKHFPGYGTNVDTHTGIAYDERSMESFESQDFLPFEAGIKAGADAVLVSHNIVTAMDENMPASLSAPVHKILRDELGFSGVIMTDDLDMGAIEDFSERSRVGIDAIKAGNDFVMCGDYRDQIPYVIDALQKGELTQERIDESVHRILLWKMQLGILE